MICRSASFIVALFSCWLVAVSLRDVKRTICTHNVSSARSESLMVIPYHKGLDLTRFVIKLYNTDWFIINVDKVPDNRKVGA